MNCSVCDQVEDSLRSLKRHYRDEHSGDIDTPEEHLPNHESEQRDFNGEEPDESDHNPEYLVSESDPTENTRISQLSNFEEGDDDD